MHPHQLARMALDDTLRQISAAALDEIAAIAESGLARSAENSRAARGQLAPRDVAHDFNTLEELAKWCRRTARRKAEIGGQDNDRNFAAKR